MAAALLGLSLAALLAVVTATDVRSRLIPDEALLAAALAVLVISALAAAQTLPERLAAAAGAGGFLFAAAVARPEGMGLGDVKLAAVLGLFLGRAVVMALLVALIAGALAGLALVARHGLAARSRMIPFAPFLAIGAAVAAMGADNVDPWN
ncbi:MAG: prepilin peptidase [Actinomycetota bacterium]|nr:prepilin peptidase [Actinomycetota bacterium]